ncbi:MAG: TatD family hydrolase [bacterium]|nr:TatD family hydrolase [bacterium]
MDELTDTHAHLTDPRFDGDLDEVLARAAAAGVRAVIDVGDSVGTSARCVGHAARHDAVFAAVGIHPNNAGRAADDDPARIAALSASPRVVAVGETGLDHVRDRSPRARQEAFFRAQLRIAAEKGLPVIMHCREAYGDLIRILRDERGGGAGGVIHCFSGSRADAEALLELGYFISVGGTLTYPGSGDLRETARSLPIGRILIETDCPYLAPQAARGRRNEPAFIISVAEELARVRGAAAGDVAAATTENAMRLFGLPRRQQEPNHRGCTRIMTDCR